MFYKLKLYNSLELSFPFSIQNTGNLLENFNFISVLNFFFFFKCVYFMMQLINETF